MSALDRAAALARCDAATEGPWRLQTCACSLGCPDRAAVKVGGSLVVECAADNDADFIANAREDLPTALALLARCRVLLADLDIRPHLVSPHPYADCGRFEKHRPGCELSALLQDLSPGPPG